MFGMNEQDTSFFWFAVTVAAYFAIRELLDTIHGIRIARWSAEKARWRYLEREAAPTPVSEPEDENEETEA